MTGARYTFEAGDRPIVEWRAHCFESLGFGRLDSASMAMRKDVDRAYVERLVRVLGYAPSQVKELLR